MMAVYQEIVKDVDGPDRNLWLTRVNHHVVKATDKRPTEIELRQIVAMAEKPDAFARNPPGLKGDDLLE